MKRTARGRILKAMAELLVITLLFSLTIASPLSAASSKLPSCKKVGQTVKADGVAYRCIKYNGKLKWSVDTKQTAPSDPVLDKVQKALDAQIIFKPLSTIEESLAGSIIAESGISQSNINEARKVLSQIYLASSIFKLPKPPVVIMGYTEKFISSNLPKYCNENLSWYPNDNTKMENWESWAFISCLRSGPVQVIPMPKTGDAFAHIQGALGSDLGYLPIGISDNTEKLPGWFVRGLKGVVGEYATSMGGKKWIGANTGVGQCYTKSLRQISFTFADVTTDYCQTSLGQPVSRYMVAMKGLEPTLAFMNELQRTGVWSEAIFADFLGMPFSQFEKESKDYARRLP